MKFAPRDYQLEAVDTAIEWLKSTLDAGLIEAFTAAGKSFIIAEIARRITALTGGKKVLVLQPNRELLLQNAHKYKLTGESYSLFSASVGSKSVRNQVVFGTALSVKNMISKFGEQFCLVILDEADASLTPTIISIIDAIREKNPNLRVLGLTSSPYKLGQGYIYRIDVNGNVLSEEQAKNPYFTKQIAHISGRYLLSKGYISPVIIGSINAVKYDTSKLEVSNTGKFTQSSLDRAFTGLGRKTSAIIEDIVYQARDRKSVLICAATQQHAAECYASLPKELSAMVTDKTPSKERERIVKGFTNCKIKYLVHVNIFNRGSDFPDLDLIALLRATESSALLHQIIGRGVRIAPGKEDCLLLDYASNLETHHPEGDLFEPNIKTSYSSKEKSYIQCVCPSCQVENEFSARQNDDGFGIDSEGYFIDLTGNRIMTEHGPIPAHYGRRCMGLELIQGRYMQCEYRYTSKECPHCHEPNDISARYCHVCRGEIIDPNTRLVIEFRQKKKDPTQIQCDKVLNWHVSNTLSSKGNECTKITFTTEYRTFTIWLQKRGQSAKSIYDYEKFLKITQGGEVMPDTITYRKNPKTGFYEVKAYCEQPDVLEKIAS